MVLTSRMLVEEVHIQRKWATVIACVATMCLGVFASLSLMDNTPFTVGGKTVFDGLDFLSSNILLPLGGLLIVIFETENDAIIVDVGMSFPDESMPGVDILVPDSVFSIRKEAFAGCSNITDFDVPIYLDELGVDAFKDINCVWIPEIWDLYWEPDDYADCSIGGAKEKKCE